MGVIRLSGTGLLASIADLSIETADIADLAVTEPKIASLAVTSGKIGSIPYQKFDDPGPIAMNGGNVDIATLVAPVTGNYLLIATGYWQSAADTDSGFVVFRINGVNQQSTDLIAITGPVGSPLVQNVPWAMCLVVNGVVQGQSMTVRANFTNLSQIFSVGFVAIRVTV